MKKKIVAYLLCMAMGVSLLPMPVIQAADNGTVVYEEDKDTEKDTETETESKTETETEAPSELATPVKIAIKGLEVNNKFSEVNVKLVENLEKDAKIKSVIWKHGKNNMTDGTIEAHKNYEVKIVVQAADNKVFKDEQVELSIGEGESVQPIYPDTVELSDENHRLTLTYTYDQDEEAYNQEVAKLKFVIDEAEKIEEKGNDYYTKESWNEFGKALNAARKLSTDSEETTIENIQEAINDLTDAEKNLVHPHKYSVKEWEWGENNESATLHLYCDECGIDDLAVSATVTKQIDQEATCTEVGKATYTASVTVNGKNYTDIIENVEIPPIAHDNTTLYKWEYATDQEITEDTRWVPFDKNAKWSKSLADSITKVRCSQVNHCNACGNEDVIETKEATKVSGREPDCVNAGLYKYEVTFGEGENTVNSDIEVIIEATGQHTIKETKAEAATCTRDGNKEYYTCNVCGKIFEDKNGTKEIKDKNSLILKATGHHIVVDVKKQPTKKAEGELVKHCRDCDDVTQTLALPKKEITIYIGAKANTKSVQKAAEKVVTTYNTEDYTIEYAKAKNAKTYEKYFSLKNAQKSGNLKSTLTINSKKLSQVKLGTIPLKVTVAGKTYTTKLKVKIAKPEAKTFKVTRKAITVGGIKGVRYDLKYNYKGATKVKIRVKNASGLNEKFDRDMTNPKSDSKKCYLNIKDSDLKQFGGKYKFQVVVYYGKNVSEMLTVEK